ncbi:hypothetical protein MMC22_004365 [Lobaria immixta]|nr:hypothetical protein [Lobaria immixta]
MQRFQSVSSVNEIDIEIQPIAASQAIKPLPSLPRGWSRVCHETGLFLRGIGLGIVVTFFQGIFTKNFVEPEKVAIRQSRITALLRTLIHVVPIGVAIFEIALNLKGQFFGPTFDKQNYLQFAAKAHEIAMQASLTTVLLSYIRYQISAGKGMPFGAVLGGLQALQVSYLWSLELWSSILSKDFHLRRKIGFAVLILICATIAATAGPSSASLLIARQGLWPKPSTYLLVNASFHDVWPDQLDDKNTGKKCATIRPDSLQYARHCPNGDISDMLLEEPNGKLIDVPTEVLGVITIAGKKEEVPMSLYSSLCHMVPKDQYCATVLQKELQSGFSSIWHHNSSMRMDGAYQFLQKNYYQPYTVASCVTDAVNDASNQAPLRFARISETDSELKKDREIVSIPGLTKGQIINNVSGDNSDFRVVWVDLPIDVFNTGIPGAVIVNSRGLNGSSYSITACTLNAGWGSSTLMTASGQYDEILSRMSNVPSSWVQKGSANDAYGYLFSTRPNFSNTSNFLYPQRRISVSKDWIQFLNPTVLLPDNSTESLMSLVLSKLQSQPTEANMAQLLNVLLANGISSPGPKHGWGAFGDLKSATRTCDACLMFEIEHSVYGWFYSPHGTTTILAITVMLAYCTLVLGHTIYSAISGISSTAWDSTAEFVALAMNSSPTKILQNTCAGIVGRRALQTPVRVLATTPGHLELVFGEVKDQNAQISELVPNEKYGKLHDSEKGSEDEEPKFDSQEYLREGLLLRIRNKGRFGEGSGAVPYS